MQVLLTIPFGVTLQLLVFLLLRRVLRMPAKAAALVVALASIALYVPYAILDWPGADVLALHLAIYLVAAYALGLITGYRDARIAGAAGFHWAPTLIIAFFVVLVLFDAVLVVIASRGLPEPVARVLLPQTVSQRDISSAFPGVVDKDFQKKEALYNAYLQQAQRQQARGWLVHKGWLGPVQAGKAAQFQVAVNDSAGASVQGAEVHGSFLRPADTRLDISFVLAETGPGVYQGQVVLPAPGDWDLVLEIRKGDELHEVRAKTSVAE